MQFSILNCYYNFNPSVVAKKLGCWLKIKLRRLKEGLKCPLRFTDSSLAKNLAGKRRFFQTVNFAGSQHLATTLQPVRHFCIYDVIFSNSQPSLGTRSSNGSRKLSEIKVKKE